MAVVAMIVSNQREKERKKRLNNLNQNSQSLTQSDSLIEKNDISVSAEGESTFLSRMMHALNEGKHVHDVTFIVGNEKIAIGAHRLILQIQSPKFYEILEINQNVFKIAEDNVTPDEFRMFLKFLYTGVVTDNRIYALPLFELAMKYDIPDLQKACNILLKKELELKSVVQMYEQACKYRQLELKQRCFNFICSNGLDILDSIEFLHFTNSNLCEVIVCDRLLSWDETQVFKAVLKWGKRQCEKKGMEPTGDNLRMELKDLIPLVRFPLMNKSDFSLEVVPSQILNEKEVISMFLYYNAKESKKIGITPEIFSTVPRLSLVDVVDDLYKKYNPPPKDDFLYLMLALIFILLFGIFILLSLNK